MAASTQLVKVTSEVTGVALSTVMDIHRRLNDAGLRSKGGRGRHGARMTALDAARLLTGMLGTAQAVNSVEAVNRYAEAHLDKKRSSEGLYKSLDLADLAALPVRHSFVDGLAAVIASASTGSLAKVMAQQDEDWTPHIEVYAFSRSTYGRIRFSGMPNGATANLEYLPASPSTAARGRPRSIGPAPAEGDLERSGRITEQTILSIAFLLKEDS